MANKISQIDLAGTPFIRIYIINNFRHLAKIEGDTIYTKKELNDIANRIKIKLGKDIIMDHYDPIINTLIFHA